MKLSQSTNIKRNAKRDRNFYSYKREALADIKQTFREEDQERDRDRMPSPFQSRPSSKRKRNPKPKGR